MAKKKHKEEQISVSFHSLERRSGDPEKKFVPITQDEFTEVCNGIDTLHKDAVLTPDKLEKLRDLRLALIKKFEIINQRTASGIFESSYWGHSFRNSEKGDISSDSLNHRPFFF